MTAFALTHAELATLLAAPHVGVLAVAASEEEPPLMTPVWYSPESDGNIAIITARSSRKARLLATAARTTFLVHEDQPPRHAAADVNVSIEEPIMTVRRRIAERYMPAETVDGYLTATADADTVLVRLRPTRWRTMDLARAAGSA